MSDKIVHPKCGSPLHKRNVDLYSWHGETRIKIERYFCKVAASTRGNIIQFIILSRHFFNRIFQNDFIAYEEEMKAKTISLLVLSASFFGYISHRFLFLYSIGIKDVSISWVDKCYLMSLFMLVIGFIAVLEWENLFPDSRDYFNLICLPINIKTILASKFVSLCMFIGIFAFGINATAITVFMWYLSEWQSTSIFLGIKFILAHLISFGLAAYFVFFILFLLIGILKAILGSRLFGRISVYIKSALLTGCAFLIGLLFMKSAYTSYFFKLFYVAKELYDPFVYIYPPLWFTGVYEFLIGNEDYYFASLSSIAVLAIVLSFFLCIFVLEFNFRLHLLKTEESSSRITVLNKVKRVFFNIFNAIFLRKPIQRAIFHFIRLTLKSSNLHRIRLASFISLSVGIILILLVHQSDAQVRSSEFNRVLLIIPHILSFFLIIGIKAVMKIPVFLEANWIFRITEAKDKQHYFIGTRKAIFFLLLVPLHLLLFVIYSFFWGISISLYHCFFSLAISFLLMEGLFYQYRKIAFTCSYLPGQEKLQFFWLFYLAGFFMYVISVSWIESILLANQEGFIPFYGFMFLIYLFARIYQKFILNRYINIKYEEFPIPVMQSLNQEA